MRCERLADGLPFSPCGRRWREAPDEGFLQRAGLAETNPSSAFASLRHLLPQGEKGRPSPRRPNLIRKLLPDLRLPASIGGARGRRQDPYPGVADRLALLAIVALAVE